MKVYERATQHRLGLVWMWVLLVSVSGPAFGAGALDPSFGTGGKVTTNFLGRAGCSPGGDGARAVLVQPDGKIIAVGNAGTSQCWDIGLARYNSDGSLDTTFGTGGLVRTDFGELEMSPNGALPAGDAALQPDGKIVVAAAVASTPRKIIVARYLSNGMLDPSFGTGGSLYLSGPADRSFGGLALQADGKIIVAGTDVAESHSVMVVFRLQPDSGLLDWSATIDFGVQAYAYDVDVQPDGRIVAAGSMYAPTTNFAFALARLDSNGQPDPTFGNAGKVVTDFPSSSESASAVVIQSDGRIVAAGDAGVGDRDWALARYDPNGILDPTFGTGGILIHNLGSDDEVVREVLVDSTGRIVAAGKSNSDFRVVRFLPNGAVDLDFAPVDFGSVDEARAAAFMPDGRIVVAGMTSTFEDADFALARYGTCAGTANAFLAMPVSDFGLVCPGGSRDLLLTIQSTGSCPLWVSGLTMSGASPADFQAPAQSFPVLLEPGGSLQVPIRFQPVAMQPPTLRSAVITLISSDESLPAEFVNVSGTAGAGDIAAEPVPVDFGQVCAGSQPEKLVNVRNQGICPLQVTAANASSGFQVIGGPALGWNLLPGASANLTVKFTPTSLGAKSGTLTVESSDPDTPLKSIPLSGTPVAGSLSVGLLTAFPPEVIQGVGACQTQQAFSVANYSSCPVTLNSLQIAGEDIADYALTGMPALPATLAPGAVLANLGVLFRPTVVDLDRLAMAQVSYVSNPLTPASASIDRHLCGEAVRTGVRVLVLDSTGDVVPLVERIQLQRKAGGVNKKPTLTSMDVAKDLTPVFVKPAAPCPPIAFHREYGGLSNPVQLLPGSYQVTASALVGGRHKSTTVGFDLTTCDFHPAIRIVLP